MSETSKITGFSFIVDHKPVGQNAVYKRGRGKRLYMTEYGHMYKTLILARTYEKLPRGWEKNGHKGAQLVFYFDSNRPDLDGPVKLVLDAMQGAAYNNDRQVTDLIIRKRIDKENPRIEITIWDLESINAGKSEEGNRTEGT